LLLNNAAYIKLIVEMKKTRELISNRFAVFAIVVVLVASTIGWFSSELVPPDFSTRADVYEKEWGTVPFFMVKTLQLHDPFHSLWYQVVLIFFFVTLLLCVLSNWRRFLRPFVSTDADFLHVKEGTDRWNVVKASWRRIKGLEAMDKDPVLWYGERFGRKAKVSRDVLPALLEHVRVTLAGRGYRVKTSVSDSSIRFKAEKGILRFAGGFALHIAILVIAVGGLIGSFLGWSEIMYGRAGDVIPLGDSDYRLRVEDFWIDMTPEEAISDFVSRVSIWKGRDSLYITNIKVNHPLSVAGYRILQHSYHTEEDEFRWAKLGYKLDRDFLWKNVVLKPGEKVFLADSSISVRVLKFYPDFRVVRGTPYTGTGFPSNPAVEVELEAMGSRTSGWLFLKYPEFNRDFDAPISLSLRDVEPVFYTGLQITTNPGAGFVLAGIALGTIALIFMLLFNYRKLVGELSTDGFYLKGVKYQWKGSFKSEFEDIGKDLLNNLNKAMKGVAIDEIDD